MTDHYTIGTYADSVAKAIAGRVALAMFKKQIDHRDVMFMGIEHAPDCAMSSAASCSCGRLLVFRTPNRNAVTLTPGAGNGDDAVIGRELQA